jgi:hypothetical protein
MICDALSLSLYLIIFVLYEAWAETHRTNHIYSLNHRPIQQVTKIVLLWIICYPPFKPCLSLPSGAVELIIGNLMEPVIIVATYLKSLLPTSNIHWTVCLYNTLIHESTSRERFGVAKVSTKYIINHMKWRHLQYKKCFLPLTHLAE